MLNTPIKASKITNLTDARYFAAWGVEWLGFSLNPADEAQLPITRIKEIKDWVEGPKMVGEFGLQSTEEIKSASSFLALDMIQLNDFATIEQAKELSNFILIKEIVVNDITSFGDIHKRIEEFEGIVRYFVLNFKKNNIFWERLSSNVKVLLATWCETYPLILSIDFSAISLAEIKSKIKPAGLEVLGGAEEKVGLKSFEELDEIFELMELE